VPFRRLPFATAFERGQVHRELLVEATRGRDSLDAIDWDWLDAEVKRRLPLLPVEA
jgi:kynurenine 3-monooxygenase